MLKSIILLSLVAAALCAVIGGGFGDVDVDDPEVVKAAHHAAQKLSKQFASKYHHKLVKINKAKQQVVAGMNYEMEVILGMTNCKKSEVNYDDVEDCDIQNNISTYKKCTVRVYKDLHGNHDLVQSGCILASRKEV